jgi:hypothetical protein
MEWFSVKILRSRKRLGLKEIETPSMEVAESAIIEILNDHLSLDFSIKEDALKKVVYVYKDANQRKLLLFYQFDKQIGMEKISVEILRKRGNKEKKG